MLLEMQNTRILIKVMDEMQDKCPKDRLLASSENSRAIGSFSCRGNVCWDDRGV
jgi:hypothetical protein